MKKAKSMIEAMKPQVLSRFYPLAGRLVGDLYVDCKDEGAPYVEVIANCSLSQVVTNPVPKNMDKLLPYKVEDLQYLGMAVQVTYFQCGGTVVGLVISHKIVDVSSCFLMANTWAAVTRNGNYDDVSAPKFEGAKIPPPPPMQDMVVGFKPNTRIVKEELTTKILTFPASKISILQEKYSGGATLFPQRRPSRVEALSAFI
ncbi:Vinorine synthase [Sesamum angolense]|uniref:Vinorine synthase n=1 Tax=Sesamum angolense TaxID=2727404 RepID=A0AAE2BVV5_9LAMI|nr:Vinorine synthase [Sesamum angolense]